MAEDKQQSTFITNRGSRSSSMPVRVYRAHLHHWKIKGLTDTRTHTESPCMDAVCSKTSSFFVRFLNHIQDVSIRLTDATGVDEQTWMNWASVLMPLKSDGWQTPKNIPPSRCQPTTACTFHPGAICPRQHSVREYEITLSFSLSFLKSRVFVWLPSVFSSQAVWTGKCYLYIECTVMFARRSFCSVASQPWWLESTADIK